MENIWRVKNTIKDFELYNKFPDVNKIILNILYNRGILEDKIYSFLNPDYDKDIYDPFLFNDMQKVADKIFDTIKNRGKICVYGDYDADGVGSCFLLVSFLKKIGGDVFCYIPDRKNEGNGLNKKAIDYIKDKGTNLIITVDNGIVAFDETNYIHSLDMEIIISDHHEQMPHRLPNAYAIINPKVEGEKYPFRELCGAGVVFKIISALALEHKDRDELLKYIKWNLDIVAVATISDLVPLVDENRVIAKYGLTVLNKTRNLGLKEIIKVSNLTDLQGVEKKEISSYDVGFRIGPRLNAAGRMDHANAAYELLMSSNKEEVRKIAEDLNEKNNERQNIVTNAVRWFIKESGDKIDDRKIIVVHNDSWPVGIVGLIAAKLKDYYNLPVFALTTEDNNIVGSGRSIEGFDITKAMQNNSNLFLKFGGHKMACGCTIAYDKYNEFKRVMSEYANQNLNIGEIEHYLDIDLEIEFKDINIDFCNEIKKFEPFGKNNEDLVFCSKNVEVVGCSIFGKNADHFKMNVKQGDTLFSVVAFYNRDLFDKIKVGDRLDLAYSIEVDNWGGKQEIRLMYKDHKYE